MDGTWIIFAFVFGLVARLLKLPPLVGFLVAGFALNAMGAESNELLEITRDLGITLLLFTIGLKLRISNMLRPEVWASAPPVWGVGGKRTAIFIRAVTPHPDGWE